MTDPFAIDVLRSALLRDTDAQAALMAEYDAVRFRSALADWAAAAGLPVADAAAPPCVVRAWPGEGWLPAWIDVADDRVEWLCFAGIAIGRPFFDQAVARARSRPFNRFLRVVTSLADLVAAAPPPVAPAGLVLHMSRCGSTLAAQMIDALPGVRAVAEPQPVDAVVRAAGLDPDRKVAALRAVAHALGRGAQATVLKLDSWHAPALPLLRRAFPDTPWAFLYRDASEVIVSHLTMRGMHTVPGLTGSELLDIADDDDGSDPAESIARAVGGVCRAVVRHWHVGGGLLIDYPSLPGTVETHLLPHFRISPDAAGRAHLAAAGVRDAKRPDRPFIADAAAKRERADAAVRAAAARHVAGPLADLDAIRTASSAPRRSS